MPYMERTGVFLAKLLSHGTKVAGSGAEQFKMQFKVTHAYDADEKTWEDWADFNEQLVSGSLNLITKANAVNEISVEQLQAAFDWNGDVDLLNDPDWKPRDCMIVVTSRTYDGRLMFDANDIRARDSDPDAVRGIKTDDPEEATNRLRSHRGAIRALCGAGPKAAAAPATPTTRSRAKKTRATTPAAAPEPEDPAPQTDGDGNIRPDPIPF